MTSWLLWTVHPVSAQGNGHASSRPASGPVSSASDSRGTATRPAVTADQAIADLRKSQTSGAAALIATEAYKFGEEARKALLDLCREKSLPDWTLQGIVDAFEYAHDQTILPVLFEIYGTGDSARDRYLTDRFRAFDAQKSMFDEICWNLERVVSPVRRRALFRVLGEIVDTPAERMLAARYLVRAFERAEFRDYLEEVNETLQKVTFHDYSVPPQWEKWLDAFAATHPDGFPEPDLYTSALRESRQRFVAEVKRAMTVAIGNKHVPPDCFDQVRYPEPSIRLHAAQELASLNQSDPATVTSAARVLAEALRTERDEDVICAVLRSLGVLAENREELKQEVGPKLVPYLKDDRDTVVVAALKAIAQTGTGSDCRAVEDLYSEAAMSKKDRSPVRSQVVTTLYSLDCGSAVIITALEDVSADVRMSAARGLGYTKRTDAAPQIAKALAAEKSDEAQRVMARALYALQSYPPEVVDALADVAGKPSVARDAAVRGLVQAASTAQLESARADRVAALLFEALPVICASPEKRKVVLDDLKAAKGELVAKVLVKWLEVEAQPDLARELAGILARLLPSGTEALAGHANALIAAGRAPAAVVLLRAAVDQAGSASAPVTTRALRHPELRVALARALLLEKAVDGLTEAETIASQELRANPDDGQLLLLRGSIREAQGKRTDAAEDLRRALKSEGAAMSDAQRQDAERRTGQLLLATDPKKAKDFLDGLPQESRDRDYLVLLGSAELALGEVRQSIAHLRTAVGPGSKEETGVARYHLIQALLKSNHAADRLEAKTLFEALDAEPPLPEGHPLLPLREEVKAQAAARNAVRDLDEISQEGATSSLATVITLGPPALPWLFHQFTEAARSAPLPALERRREAVQAILASDTAAARAFAALAPPANGSPREAWIDFSARAADWWDKRK